MTVLYCYQLYRCVSDLLHYGVALILRRRFAKGLFVGACFELAVDTRSEMMLASVVRSAFAILIVFLILTYKY